LEAIVGPRHGSCCRTGHKASSQANLGYMLANGDGVPRDYPGALRWYQLRRFRFGHDYQTHEGRAHDGQGEPAGSSR
jgi:hypothetical protein